MTREEFFDWLNTCPTTWFMEVDDYDYVILKFTVDDTDSEENDD